MQLLLHVQVNPLRRPQQIHRLQRLRHKYQVQQALHPEQQQITHVEAQPLTKSVPIFMFIEKEVKQLQNGLLLKEIKQIFIISKLVQTTGNIQYAIFPIPDIMLFVT